MVVQRRVRWAAQAAPSAGARVYGVFKEKEKKTLWNVHMYVNSMRTQTPQGLFASTLDASAVQAHILSEFKQEHFTCKYRSIQTDWD